MQAYPRPDWTFRPSSRADFSERSKNVARLLQQPLQKTQEFLARIFGFPDLHALQAELVRVEADPESHPPGPFMDALMAGLRQEFDPEVTRLKGKGVRFVNEAERDNHLLSATIEFCFGDVNHFPADRQWDVREIDLFGSLDQHRVSFARIRDKWRLLDAADSEAEPTPSDLDSSDYAHLEIRPSGRRVLRFTPAGQAVNDACFHVRLKLEGDLRGAINQFSDSPSQDSRKQASITSAYLSALEQLEGIQELHPRNPWAMASLISVAVDFGVREKNYVDLEGWQGIITNTATSSIEY